MIVCIVSNIVGWIGCNFSWGRRFGTICWSRIGLCNCHFIGLICMLLWHILRLILSLSWSSLLFLVLAYSCRCYPIKSMMVLVDRLSSNLSFLSIISTFLIWSLSFTLLIACILVLEIPHISLITNRDFVPLIFVSNGSIWFSIRISYGMSGIVFMIRMQLTWTLMRWDILLGRFDSR